MFSNTLLDVAIVYIVTSVVMDQWLVRYNQKISSDFVAGWLTLYAIPGAFISDFVEGMWLRLQGKPGRFR